MKQQQPSPLNAIQMEIARIDQQLDRLQAERNALTRLAARLKGGLRNSLSGDLPEAVSRCLDEAPANGLKMADMIVAVQRNGGAWTEGSIKTTLYRLRQQGYARLEGHWWKPPSTET